MRIRRLEWAGVELDHDGHTLVIDYVREVAAPLPPIFVGAQTVTPLRPGAATAALVTHLHSDHADPVALSGELAAGAPVLRPEPNPGSGDDLVLTEGTETLFRETGLAAMVMQPWEQKQVGPFRITAAPSVDGFGDPQRCWIVEAGSVRILHAGDTLFHGYWWSIARAAGPIDVAFLPINGAVVDAPHLHPSSPLGISMSPEEAAVAAQLLQARVAVPIHYDIVQKIPQYVEAPDGAKRFAQKARELDVEPLVAAPGDWFLPR